MTSPLTGGCACGAVRYECAVEPILVAHCHCRDCQRASGGQMATVAAVPKGAFRVLQGQTKCFDYTGSSGKGLTRHFCPNCGSRLFTTDLGLLPDMMFIAVGNLDEPARAVPQMHIFTASAQPWAVINDGLPKFPGMPS